MDRCDQCGFVYRDLPRADIAEALREVAHQYRSRLAGHGDVLRRRPAPAVWSPLEYAAHVRDVLRVQRERAALALRVREPTVESMRPDERAVEAAYAQLDPGRVVDQIDQAVEALAALFDGLGYDEWDRTAIYNWPQPARRDLTWIGRHTVHELIHHLFDIARGVEPTPVSASG
ncbi:MAG: DinB family protein [Acidimicrobiales bacterium]